MAFATPPQTPPHPPRQSSFNSATHISPARSSAHSRRSSTGYSPSSRLRSSHSGFEGRNSGIGYGGMSEGGGGGGGGGGMGMGMANLADELGDAWGSDDNDEDEDGFEDGPIAGDDNDADYQNGMIENSTYTDDLNENSTTELANGASGSYDSLMNNNQTIMEDGSLGSASSPSTIAKQSRGRRRAHTTLSRPRGSIGTISETNGIAEGLNADNDNEDEAFSLELDARLAEVHELAEAGTALVGEEGGAAVRRMLGRLQELGSQSGMDAAVTCLATAYAALSTHLNHQSRQLASLTSTLFTPFAAPLPQDITDPLLPDIDLTLSSLPHPPSGPLRALHSLVSPSSSDVLTALSHLADSLHEARQAYQGAGRRLRSAREIVEELRREREAAEEGVRWLEKNGWPDRLRARECAKECREVLGGFEEVCEDWKKRFFRQGSVVG